jgi:hypothetical protein
LSLSYGVGIRDPEKKPIKDPGSESRVKKAPDPGSGSATLLEGPVLKYPFTINSRDRIGSAGIQNYEVFKIINIKHPFNMNQSLTLTYDGDITFTQLKRQ